MFYTYFLPAGSQVADHAMTNNPTDPWWFRLRCMDPAPCQGQGANCHELLDMGRATNPSNAPDAVDGHAPGSILNGTVDPQGHGVCEGPAVFKRPTVGANPVTYTYVMYSRNGTISPEYGVYYRKSASGVAGLELGTSEPTESVLVQSARRMLVGGVSFGHGEVFQFFGRYCLVFHVKETSPDGSFPLTRYGARTVYFKELTFDETTGDILPLSCDQTIPALDVNVFLAPLPAGAPAMQAIVGPEE